MSDFFQMTHPSDSSSTINHVENSSSASQSKDVDDYSQDAKTSYSTKQSGDYSETDDKREISRTNAPSQLENRDQSGVSELEDERLGSQKLDEEKREDSEIDTVNDEISATKPSDGSATLSKTITHLRVTEFIPPTLSPSKQSDVHHTNDIESVIQSSLQNVKEEAVSSDDSESSKQEVEESEGEGEGEGGDNDEGDDEGEGGDSSNGSNGSNGSTEQVLSTNEEEGVTNEIKDEIATINIREKERGRERKKRLKKRFQNRSVKNKKILPRTKTLLNYTFVKGYKDQRPCDLVLVTSVEMKGVGFKTEVDK